MKKKYLPLYKSSIKSKRLPLKGLCACFPNDPDLKLFEPTLDEAKANGHLTGYWGNEMMDINQKEPFIQFNEFRQNVMLLLAALNNEL